MTMNEGATIYSPGGTLLQTGDRLRQPGLVHALELLADEGPRSAYEGSLGRALLELMDERGGLVTRDDLAAYEAVWSEPVEVRLRGHARADARGAGAARRLPGSAPAAARSVARATAPSRSSGRSTGRTATGDTTNLVTVDTEGNACVLTSSLGLGAGDWLPGLDMHLNSMLGESDLIREPLRPGERMGSMMSPTLALDGDGPRLRGRAPPAGRACAARSCRCWPAMLDEGLAPAGGGRPAAPPPGGGRRSPRAGARARGRDRARGGRLGRARVAGAAPLLRRRQRRHAGGRGR